jgi:hypothetical protein
MQGVYISLGGYHVPLVCGSTVSRDTAMQGKSNMQVTHMQHTMSPLIHSSPLIEAWVKAFTSHASHISPPLHEF